MYPGVNIQKGVENRCGNPRNMFCKWRWWRKYMVVFWIVLHIYIYIYTCNSIQCHIYIICACINYPDMLNNIYIYIHTYLILVAYNKECYLVLDFFCGRVCFFWGVPGSMLSCFSDFLLLCFSCFSAFLLFAFPASLLFCFSVFPASLLLYFCAFLLLLFYFFFSSVMCFCCCTSCSFASLLPVSTVSVFFIVFCFILFCLYPKWNPRERNSKKP